MIRFSENIKKQLISLYLSLETLLKIGLLSKRPTIPKTEDKAIWILANGPSLKKNLAFFHHNTLTTGVVNHFASHSSYELIQPKYYFLQAPEFWLDDLLPIYIEVREKLFRDIVDKTTWPLILFLPFNSKKFKENLLSLSTHPNIQIIYYNDTPIEGLSALNHYFFSKQLGMPRPHNILIPSIMLSMQMGFKDLYLLGVDHSWLPELSVDDDNNALLSQKHFYDQDKAKAKTMQKLGKGQRHLHEILHKFYLTFQGYFTIKEYADQKGVAIYNCTKDSFIDAFKKMDLSSLFPSTIEHKTEV